MTIRCVYEFLQRLQQSLAAWTFAHFLSSKGNVRQAHTEVKRPEEVSRGGQEAFDRDWWFEEDTGC